MFHSILYAYLWCSCTCKQKQQHMRKLFFNQYISLENNEEFFNSWCSFIHVSYLFSKVFIIYFVFITLLFKGVYIHCRHVLLMIKMIHYSQQCTCIIINYLNISNWVWELWVMVAPSVGCADKHMGGWGIVVITRKMPL